MIVLIGENTYEVTKLEAKKVLNVAANIVHKGIYAIEKDGYVELKSEFYMDDKELSDAIAGYVRNGFKVHFNGGPS